MKSLKAARNKSSDNADDPSKGWVKPWAFDKNSCGVWKTPSVNQKITPSPSFISSILHIFPSSPTFSPAGMSLCLTRIPATSAVFTKSAFGILSIFISRNSGISSGSVFPRGCLPACARTCCESPPFCIGNGGKSIPRVSACSRTASVTLSHSSGGYSAKYLLLPGRSC